MAKNYKSLGLLLISFLFFTIFIGYVGADPYSSTFSYLQDVDDDNDDLPDDDGDDEIPDDDDDDEIPDDDDDDDNLEEEKDDDNDGVDDDLEDANERNVEIEDDESEIQIESTLKTGENKDKIKIIVGYDDDGVSVEIKYESEFESSPNLSQDDDGSTEIELEFKVVFRSLIEYIDLDENNVYDPSIDETVQKYSLKTFKPAIYTSTEESNDTTLHFFKIETEDGVFVANFYVVEEFIKLNDTIITPTQVKIDIEINNFNFNSENSRLALYIKLESSAEYGKDDETEDEIEGYSENEVGVSNTINEYSGIFTWTESAVVDGDIITVTTSNIDVDDEDSNEQKIYLNYPQGTTIIHDPKIGVAGILQPDPTSDANNLIFGYNPIIILGIMGIMGVIVAFSLIRRRSRLE